ncbi:unannotated protein [freshwater metagenome]|uniref:Unannotated protein n=1 Tax=freshwater metagenome TaxID=449393 RepID=A0A6J7FIX8_9ZZZZ
MAIVAPLGTYLGGHDAICGIWQRGVFISNKTGELAIARLENYEIFKTAADVSHFFSVCSAFYNYASGALH